MFLLWLRQLPRCGYQTPASVPLPAEGRFSPTNFPVSPLVASSYQVLCASVYCFPLVRYSSLLSAGFQHALLCLKMYSWCIHEERCTPHPPTPPPSCSPPLFIFRGRLCITVMWSSGYRAFPLQTWWFVCMAEVLVNYPTEWNRFFPPEIYVSLSTLFVHLSIKCSGCIHAQYVCSYVCLDTKLCFPFGI